MPSSSYLPCPGLPRCGGFLRLRGHGDGPYVRPGGLSASCRACGAFGLREGDDADLADEAGRHRVVSQDEDAAFGPADHRRVLSARCQEDGCGASIPDESQLPARPASFLRAPFLSSPHAVISRLLAFCRRRRMAFASICLVRSLVTPLRRPVCSSVSCRPRPRRP